nr:MAG: hypothetical protein EDM05_21940 [Leptolyngbya sp. IPPAS B-1204]
MLMHMIIEYRLIGTLKVLIASILSDGFLSLSVIQVHLDIFVSEYIIRETIGMKERNFLVRVR